LVFAKRTATFHDTKPFLHVAPINLLNYAYTHYLDMR
jgi:hypothetical protein